MIARIWHGAVPAAKMQQYLSPMRNVALPDYLATPGNRGAWCLTRTEGNLTHFEMLTFWQDIEAIKRFAGDDHSKAKHVGTFSRPWEVDTKLTFLWVRAVLRSKEGPEHVVVFGSGAALFGSPLCLIPPLSPQTDFGAAAARAYAKMSGV